jgi:hypothetical protein
MFLIYIGVNMPTKAVVFNGFRKHDGKSLRDLTPGEYIQMAGRAGRRGLDKVGTVIITLWNDLPPECDIKTLMTGKPVVLASQFRLRYNMILNLVRVNNLSVQQMIKSSFTEFSAQKLLTNHDLFIKKIRYEDYFAHCLQQQQQLLENTVDSELGRPEVFEEICSFHSVVQTGQYWWQMLCQWLFDNASSLSLTSNSSLSMKSNRNKRDVSAEVAVTVAERTWSERLFAMGRLVCATAKGFVGTPSLAIVLTTPLETIKILAEQEIRRNAEAEKTKLVEKKSSSMLDKLKFGGGSAQARLSMITGDTAATAAATTSSTGLKAAVGDNSIFLLFAVNAEEAAPSVRGKPCLGRD